MGPASFSVVDAQKRTRWTLEIDKALRFTPETAGEDPAPPIEQTDDQVIAGARKFFGELAYLKPAIASCQIAMLRGQRAVRCTGTANVSALREEAMQLVTYADAAFRWAMVYFAEDAAGFGEADSIAGSIELR